MFTLSAQGGPDPRVRQGIDGSLCVESIKTCIKRLQCIREKYDGLIGFCSGSCNQLMHVFLTSCLGGGHGFVGRHPQFLGFSLVLQL